MPLFRPLLALALLLGSMQGAVAGAAGKVVYAFGDVHASSADGATRALARGDAILPGDTVTTRNGRTQLRFTDGGFAALQPNTEYKVEDYNFDGEADGSERSFMSLVRGSVRLVTGLIGHANRNNFRLRTPVATIGIRGTSGKISHCDSECGERGPGTSLAGYGGIWDLASGSFSGPVTPGEAKFCNGASCFDIPGFGQRSEVVAEEGGELERTLDDNEESVSSGDDEPFYSDGNDFAVEQGATAPVIASGLVGAIAGREDFVGPQGGTGSGDAVVILVDGVPISVIAVGDDEADDFEFVVSDLSAFLTALQGLGDAAARDQIEALFDSVSAADLARLAADPASPAGADFGRTSDNRLLLGRWQDGFLLVLDTAASILGSRLEYDLVELRGDRSEHFIFGPDPGVLPGSGQAVYAFTGGTLSTAVDGSSLGEGVTNGELRFDFLRSVGEIDMVVRHGGIDYRILGGLAIHDRFFRQTTASARTPGGSAYGVLVDGFFAHDGARAPLAAGLGYTIKTAVNIVGVAGFGLAATRPSGGLPQGAWVGFAHNFVGGGLLQSEAFDFLVDADNNAVLNNNVVTAFTSHLHDVCAGGTACMFDRNGVNFVRDPTGPNGATALPDVGIRWARFAPGYNVQHGGLSGGENLNGSALTIAVDVPTPAGDIPAQGSGLAGVYNAVVGGTRARVSYVSNGVQQPEVNSTIDSAELYVDFDAGSVDASFAGSFPTSGGTASWNLFGSDVFSRGDGIHSTGVSGFVSGAGISGSGGSPDCSSSCSLNGHTHFVLGAVDGSVAAGVLQAFHGGSPGVNLAWGYVLRDADGPGPVQMQLQ